MFPQKNHRTYEKLNAGSMADIAFLLLIFFFVATTIVSDKGILVKLPPYITDNHVTPPGKNVLSIKINADNEILIEGTPARIEELKERTVQFISNPEKSPLLPDKPTKAVISLQNDRGTFYETYLAVYNELYAAYHQLWDISSKRRFGKMYSMLSDSEKRQVRKEIPLILSEAEPTNFE